MGEKLTVFDPAEKLGEEDFQAYLADAFESGDPSEMLLALGDVARARNMSELARQTGITRVGITKALAGGNPTLDTISKLAGALGYKLTIQPVLSMPAEPNAGAKEVLKLRN